MGILTKLDTVFYSIFLGQPKSTFILFFLCCLRIIPILSNLSVLSPKIGPAHMRVLLMLSIVLLLFPYICISNTPTTIFIPDLGFLMLLMIKEILIGLYVGFIINLPIALIQSAGIISDHARGASSMMGSDPLTKDQSSPSGSLYSSVSIVIFFYSTTLLPTTFNFIKQTFSWLPVLTLPTYTNHNHSFFYDIVLISIKLFEESVKIACQLASPILAATLIIDISIGLIGKNTPQLQVSFLSTALKSLSGVVILAFSWQPFTKHLGATLTEWTQHTINIQPEYTT